MQFVFCFGYETPSQTRLNDRHGWDDECSQWCLIEAVDEAAALDWGCEVAERFVQSIGHDSWRAGNFAHWVEPASNRPWAVGRAVLNVGELPDFQTWDTNRIAVVKSVRRFAESEFTIISATFKFGPSSSTLKEIASMLSAKGVRLGQDEESPRVNVPAPKPATRRPVRLRVLSTGEEFVASNSEHFEFASAPGIHAFLYVKLPVQSLMHLVGQEIEIQPCAEDASFRGAKGD